MCLPNPLLSLFPTLSSRRPLFSFFSISELRFDMKTGSRIRNNSPAVTNRERFGSGLNP